MNVAAFFTRHRAIIFLLALGLASRFFHLDHRGLWTDEFKTLATTRMSPSELVKERMSKGHFPTYFLMVRGWTAIAGDGEKSLRFPSLVAGILAIFFIHRAASKIWGTQVAFWAALFFVVNERALWASQEARSYSWVMLAAIASFDALIQALKFPAPLRWAAYALWTLLGMLLHATYPWVFLSQIVVIAVWLGRIRRARWDWIGVTAALFLTGGAAYKLLASLQTNESFYSERHWTEPAKIIEGFLEIFWGEYSQGFGQSFDLYAPLITLGLIALAWRNTRHPSGNSLGSPGESPPPDCSPPVFALTSAWAVSALVGMVLYSALVKDVVHGARYYSAGVGGAAILESLAIAPLRRKEAKVFLAAICLAIHTLSSAAWYRNSGDRIRQAVHWVAERRSENAPVIFCNSQAELIADYYHLGVKPATVRRQTTDPAELEQFLSTTAGNAEDFWILLYKEKYNPLTHVTKSWTQGRFEVAEKKDFGDSRAFHYHRVH